MLIAHWKLDGNTLNSITTAPDGTLVGTPNWVAGHLGTDTALKFNGTSNYITAGTSLNITGQFSILMWVKVGTSTSSKALISKGESIADRNQNYGLMLGITNRIVFPIGDGTNYRTFITNTGIPDSNWHHVAAVFISSTEMNVYLDGVLQAGTYIGSATTPATNTMRTIIGASSTTTELFDGTLQEIKIHDTALTAGQVVTDYGGCPALSVSLSVTATTGGFTFTSTAVGGVPTNDGFGHEILVDNVIAYSSGLGKATTVSGTINTTQGTHIVVSRITDGCIPSHQVATSQPVTVVVDQCTPSVCGFIITE